MVEPNAKGLISFLGLWVQLGGLALLIGLFQLLTRHAGRRPYFATWARAWEVLFIAIVAVLLRYIMVAALSTDLLAETTPTARLLYFVYQLAKLVFLGLLLAGTLEYQHGATPYRSPWPWVGGIIAYAALSVAFSDNLERIVFWQGLIAIAVFGYSGLALFTLPRARRTLGTRVTAAMFQLLTVLWLLYVVAFGVVRRSGASYVINPLGFITQYNSFFDIVLAMGLAFGMVVMLLEDSEREIEEARAARLRDVAASEASLASVIESATDAIVTLDESRRIVVFNPAAEAIFRCSFADAIDGKFERFIAPRALAQVDELLRAEDGPASRNRPATTIQGRRADDQEFPMELSVSANRMPGATARILIIRDITDRLAAEVEQGELKTRLAQSLRMEAVGRLVSGVAHELNNPLAAILTFSEDLLRDPPPDLPTEPLVIIRDQAHRARAIVRDLLAFVRRRDERREPIAPEELAERVTLALNKEFERAGVRLVLDFDHDLPRITGDSVGLEQVLTNLLDNARRASGVDGIVRLSAHTNIDGLEFIVEDSGPGIPEDVLHRIFEPFFTTRSAGQGTGLGLSVSMGIVEQHGGSLRAENRAPPEKGARFIAVLPFGIAAEERRLTPRQQTVPVAFAPAPAVPRITGPRSNVRIPRVLLIDDEAPVRAAMRRFFERKGWRVDEAGDGSEGLDLLLTAELGKPYDVVISDLKMPGVSGIELHRRLASSHPALLRRLVIATGDTASRRRGISDPDRVSGIGEAVRTGRPHPGGRTGARREPDSELSREDRPRR